MPSINQRGVIQAGVFQAGVRSGRVVIQFGGLFRPGGFFGRVSFMVCQTSQLQTQTRDQQTMGKSGGKTPSAKKHRNQCCTFTDAAPCCNCDFCAHLSHTIPCLPVVSGRPVLIKPKFGPLPVSGHPLSGSTLCWDRQIFQQILYLRPPI